MPRWTEKEMELLETLWPKHNTDEICRRLNRSNNSVARKANLMGLGSKTQSSDYVTVLSILTTIYGQSARGRVKRFIDNGLPARKSKLRKNKGTWIIKLRDFWKWAKANQDKLNFAHFEKYTLGSLRKAVLEGDVDNGSLMAGQVAGMVNEIQPVATIIKNLFDDCKNELNRLESEI